MEENIIWDDYNEMCQEVMDGLAADDIKQLKFSLRRFMTKKELEKIVDGQDLILALEKHDLLSEKNVHLLYNLLVKKFGKMANIVETYESHRKGCFKSYNQDKYDISSMSIAEHFVKTDAMEEITKFVTQKGAALIKGANGAGKSQASYVFANEFYKDHRDSVIWQLHCKSLQDISLSLATLLTKLDILKDQESSQKDLAFSVQCMFDVVLKALTSGSLQEKIHLIIMDDVHNPTDDIICEMIDRFIHAKNIYLIATSNGAFTSEMTSKFGIEISAMGENEALELLKFTTDDECELKQLAKMLNYLPLAISVASSFMQTTKISASEYLTNLSVYQSQAHQREKKGQNLQASYDMALSNVEKSLSEYSKQLLSYMPYLSYTNISIKVLKSLLPEGTPNEKIEITKFVSALQSYSLASVTRIGKERSLHMHGLLVLALRDRKTKTQENEDITWLLKYYCRQMSIDMRRVEAMHRNMAFLDHACLLINTFSCRKESDSKDTLLYKCYLSLCIALTFRIYGRTEVSAKEHFEMGQKLMFKFADSTLVFRFESDVFAWIVSDTKHDDSKRIDPVETTSPRITCGMDSFLKGAKPLVKDADAIFQLLLNASCDVSTDCLENLVMKKFRKKREMCLLFRACNQLETEEIAKNCIPSKMIPDLISQGYVMPLDILRGTFLVELFILLLYNSSANKWWVEEANALHVFSEGRHLSVSHESLAEFQLVYNLSNLLDTYYHNKHPSFHPILPFLTRRSGIIYFLRNNIVKPTVSEITRAIEILNKMLDERSERYILLGFMNMGSDMDIHHMCNVLELLRECYVKLSYIDPSNKDYYITQALAKTSILESYLEDLEPWSHTLLPKVHLAIADMSILINTPAMARKARKHFRLAIANGNAQEDMTRVVLKSYKRYIDFCMKHGGKEDLDEVENLCQTMLSKFKETPSHRYFQTQLDCVKQHKIPLEDVNMTKMSDKVDKLCDRNTKYSTGDLECDALPDYMQYNSHHEHDQSRLSSGLRDTDSRFERLIKQLEERERERLTIERERLAIERERLIIAREKIAKAKKTNETPQALVSNFRKTDSCLFVFIILVLISLIYLYCIHWIPI